MDFDPSWRDEIDLRFSGWVEDLPCVDIGFEIVAN